MGFFLRAVFVLVGLANIYGPVAVEVLSDPAALSRVAARLSNIPPVFLLAAVPAGLLAAEVLLRLMRPELEGEFLYRYGVIVFGVFLGGVLMGAFLGLLLGLGTLEGAIGVAVLGAMVGGGLGFQEGLILAVPLAAILGLFRNNPNGSRSRTTAT